MYGLRNGNSIWMWLALFVLVLYLLLIALGDFLAELSEMLHPSCVLMTQDVIFEVLLII